MNHLTSFTPVSLAKILVSGMVIPTPLYHDSRCFSMSKFVFPTPHSAFCTWRPPMYTPPKKIYTQMLNVWYIYLHLPSSSSIGYGRKPVGSQLGWFRFFSDWTDWHLPIHLLGKDLHPMAPITIHVWYIYQWFTYIWLILMVNVG